MAGNRQIRMGSEVHVMCLGCYLEVTLEASKPGSDLLWPEVIGFTDAECDRKFGCGKSEVRSE